MAKSKLIGGKELEAALKSLPQSMQRGVLVSTLKAAGKPLLEEMRRTVPQEEGDLQDSLAMVTGKKSSIGGGVEVIIGPRNRPAKRFVGWRGHFAEFGTVHHAADPFVMPSFEAKKEQMLATIRLDLARVVTRKAKQLSKKA